MTTATATAPHRVPRMPTATPFLTFEGDAEAAIALYTEVLPGSELLSLDRWPEGTPGEGTVLGAVFTVAGLQVRASDSPVEHAHTFTPSVSFFVELDSEEELLTIHAALGHEGRELMPPADYGFSKLFTWIDDRFGVSWQLNVAA